MRTKFIYEKFTEKDSDPIRDMKIGMNFPIGFEPMFRLLKQYPGMDYPIGSIFGKKEGWDSLSLIIKNEKNQNNEFHHSGWSINYFTPWIGEYFEKLY